jgi:signal peptidase II
MENKLMSKLSERISILFLVLGNSIGFDQTTKRIAEYSLGENSYSFFCDTIRIHFVKNAGAFLGFGADFSHVVKLWLFFILPAIFLLLAAIAVIADKNLSVWSRIMISLMISGGLSNLIDRIFLDGLVTDFVNLGIGSLRTGIFNIADVSIMIGAIGMLFMQNKTKTS